MIVTTTLKKTLSNSIHLTTHLINVYQIHLKNKKVLGLMRDENNIVIIIDFIGLRAKMYLLLNEKAKSVKRSE